jgi:hypothetical protein
MESEIAWFEVDAQGTGESLEWPGMLIVGAVDGTRRIRLPAEIPEHGGRELAVLARSVGSCPRCGSAGAARLQLEDGFWCVVCRGGCGFVCCRERQP